MKANELRIGDEAFDEDITQVTIMAIGCEQVKVMDISACVYYCSTKSLQPITLTEEWLIKFGFEYNSFSLLYEKGNVCGEFCDEFYFIMNNTEYMISSVHQLQNLYFALTNEELTIK